MRTKHRLIYLASIGCLIAVLLGAILFKTDMFVHEQLKSPETTMKFLAHAVSKSDLSAIKYCCTEDSYCDLLETLIDGYGYGEPRRELESIGSYLLKSYEDIDSYGDIDWEYSCLDMYCIAIVHPPEHMKDRFYITYMKFVRTINGWKFAGYLE